MVCKTEFESKGMECGYVKSADMPVDWLPVLHYLKPNDG